MIRSKLIIDFRWVALKAMHALLGSIGPDICAAAQMTCTALTMYMDPCNCYADHDTAV